MAPTDQSSEKNTPLRSRPITDLTLAVVPAGSEANAKLPTFALQAIPTLLMRNFPVKPCTGAVTFIEGSTAVQRISRETLAGSLGRSSRALCRLW
jgi:hypothetical protein